MLKNHTSRLFLGWLCLFLLASSCLADDPIKVSDTFQLHEATVGKEKHFEMQVSETQIKVIESKEKTLFITVQALQGNGIWTLSGKDPRESDNQGLLKKVEGAFIHNVAEIVGVGPDSPIWNDVQKSGAVYLTVKNSGVEESPIKLAYVAESSDIVDTVVGAHHKIHVKNLTTLKLRTKITKAEGNHHFKFMLEALQQDNNPVISAEFYQERSSGAKSASQRFLKFDQDRIGYVVGPEDKNFYCQETSCNYVITANLKDVRILDFYIGEHIDFELINDEQSTVSSTLTRSGTLKKFLKKKIFSSSTSPV